MPVQQQRTTETGLAEVPVGAADTVCPWCCGPTDELFPRRDSALLGHRYVDITVICRDCDVVIRLSWPSAPHTRRPHV